MRVVENNPGQQLAAGAAGDDADDDLRDCCTTYQQGCISIFIAQIGDFTPLSEPASIMTVDTSACRRISCLLNRGGLFKISAATPAVQFAAASPPVGASLLLELGIYSIFFTRFITSVPITFLSSLSSEWQSSYSLPIANSCPTSTSTQASHPPTKILGHLALGTKSLDTTNKLHPSPPKPKSSSGLDS